MARRLWLSAASLLILPVLAFGYGRLGGFHRNLEIPAGPFPEPGLVERGDAPDQDSFRCPVCATRGRDDVVVRGDARTHLHADRRYHLCSGGCLDQFRKNPAYFLAALAERVTSPGDEVEPEQEM